MPINPMSIIQTLMGNLKTKNPQNFQTVNALMQNNGNPQALLQQVLSGINSEQKQAILNQAKQFGCPDSILSQIQNIK